MPATFSLLDNSMSMSAAKMKIWKPKRKSIWRWEVGLFEKKIDFYMEELDTITISGSHALAPP
jgi:hypothetical protein